jgi:spore maturation protein CgeB
MEVEESKGDVVWIGNWGDDERTAELNTFLLKPVKDLKLRARVHGVRYPEAARTALKDAGIDYAGWLPNYEAPRVLAGFKATVHIPRRPYVEALPGIPTIRVFEALACGIPLVSAPWDDTENLFAPGLDFLVARDSEEMKRHLNTLIRDREAAEEIASRGLRKVLRRHTCAHRVDELLRIYSELAYSASSNGGGTDS